MSSSSLSIKNKRRSKGPSNCGSLIWYVDVFTGPCFKNEPGSRESGTRQKYRLSGNQSRAEKPTDNSDFNCRAGDVPLSPKIRTSSSYIISRLYVTVSHLLTLSAIIFVQKRSTF